LAETVRRLIACCRVQVLDATIIQNGYDFESRFELDPHDAVVFASVDAALRERTEGEKLFVNTNSRDFVDPKIEEHLDQHGCKLITNFIHARQIVERAIRAARAPEAARSKNNEGAGKDLARG